MKPAARDPDLPAWKSTRRRRALCVVLAKKLRRRKVPARYDTQWAPEDYEPGRFVGKHRCPVCGMRAMTAALALACCEKLIPKQSNYPPRLPCPP